MEVSNGEMLSLFPRNNYVLLKPIEDMETVKMESGIEFYIDGSYKPENHARVLCEVHTRPFNIFYSKEKALIPYSMEYLTELDLYVKETVLISYLAALQGEKRFHLVLDGEKYYLVKYEDIYLTIRNNNLWPLNGYIIVEPIIEEIKSDHIIIPDQGTNNFVKDGDGSDYRKEAPDRLGIVKKIGRPNREYRHKKEYDDDIIAEGMKVMMKNPSNIKLEADNHRMLFKEKMYVMQRKDLIGYY